MNNKNECEVVYAVKELIKHPFIVSYGRKTVEHLMEHIDVQDATVDRLIGNVAKLQREKEGLLKATELSDIEKKRLGDMLDSDREARKVELPRLVAEAIETLKVRGYSSYGIIDRIQKVSNEGRYIREWIDESPLSFRWDLIIKALANGYTVADPPTTEDLIQKRLTVELCVRQVQSPIPPAELARLLTLAVREVMAEQPSQESI